MPHSSKAFCSLFLFICLPAALTLLNCLSLLSSVYSISFLCLQWQKSFLFCEFIFLLVSLFLSPIFLLNSFSLNINIFFSAFFMPVSLPLSLSSSHFLILPKSFPIHLKLLLGLSPHYSLVPPLFSFSFFLPLPLSLSPSPVLQSS